MRWVHAGGLGGMALAALIVACSEESANEAEPQSDAGASSGDGGTSSRDASDAGAPDDVVDAGPVVHTIAIHVTTPSSAFSRGGPATPTWAVRLDDARSDAGADAAADAWQPLIAKIVGEYEITTTARSFTVAFACANDNRSLVTVLTRATDIASLDVELADYCGSVDTETTDLTGTFTGLGADTGWLDFGYAFGARGAVFPTSAGKGDYELVNLVSGTWDLAFGVRDDFGEPFSKILIARDQALPKGSASFDADFASAKAFTPGSKSLSLRNLEAEQTHGSVVYALNNATTGLEIGPANDPDNAIMATVDFPTVPSSLQKESDRYRVSAITVADMSSQRGAFAVFHEATDVALDLPPEVSAPTAKVVDGRIATTMKTRAGSEVYEARVFSKVSNQSSREWRVSTSASLVSAGGIGGAQPSEIALIPPDLSNVGDFKSVWLTPAGLSVQVTAAVHEKHIPLGDGHVARFAQSSITMDNP